MIQLPVFILFKLMNMLLPFVWYRQARS